MPQRVDWRIRSGCWRCMGLPQQSLAQGGRRHDDATCGGESQRRSLKLASGRNSPGHARGEGIP